MKSTIKIIIIHLRMLQKRSHQLLRRLPVGLVSNKTY